MEPQLHSLYNSLHFVDILQLARNSNCRTHVYNSGRPLCLRSKHTCCPAIDGGVADAD